MKNLRISAILAFIIALSANVSIAQTSATLLTVDGEKITLDDFENIYRKNNRDSLVTKEALDEYIDLFINFKLKVKEAEDLGMDTSAAFVRELEGYRKQLARPYLTDEDKLDELIQIAYERTKTEVNAAHILVKVDENAAPADTLKAWNRIMAMRKKAMEGADFAGLAKGKGGSEDPSAQQNGGDLGYFSAFQMVYPFEEAAFAGKVGEITMPVRTRFGYHILEVKDKRPAQGQVRVAHIMIKSSAKAGDKADERAKRKIEEIREKIVSSGAEFEQMAADFSEDGSSAKSGGLLDWFGTGRMVANFETASFALKNKGDISDPIKTEYGWHIIKKIDNKPVPDFDEVQAELKKKVQRDKRAEATKASFLAKLKKEYNYTTYPKNLKKVYAKLDSNIYEGSINYKAKKLAKPAFSFAGKKYSIQDVANAVNKTKGQNRNLNYKDFLDFELNKLAEKELMAHENSQLERKHKAFRLLMQEYHDGILLFELMNEKVWNKAVTDSTGLAEFYQANQNKYMWEDRAALETFKVKDQATADRIVKLLKQGKTKEEVREEVNAKSALNVTIASGTFEKSDNPDYENVIWETGVTTVPKGKGQFLVVRIADIVPAGPKTLEEARGLVTNDYQSELEESWIAELRSKHAYKLNESVLYSIVD